MLVRTSPYLTLFDIPAKCRGFEDEPCDNAPTHVIAMAETAEDDAIDITLQCVCVGCAQLWQAQFTEPAQA